MERFDLGAASISPDSPAVAGGYHTITLTYTAGHPIDDSGFLKIAFRHVGDYGTPQFDKPDQPNYCSIRTDGDCRILPRWDPYGHIRPWSRALFLQVRGGYLDKGEHITVVFGDTSGGSPGWQMPTFCVSSFGFKTLVDPIATRLFKELPYSPEIAIIPGPPARAVCIAPSEVPVSQPFSYYMKLEDRWGNPAGLPGEIAHAGFPDAGVQFIEAVDKKTGLSARSNPIEVVPLKKTRHVYWADFHGQSEETVGSGTIEDYFTFGRDYALLDILGHQGNDFQVTDEFWYKVNYISKEYYQPGKFVTFPGYEYSANTPLGGDRNVYFTSEGGGISRSSCELLPGQTSKYPDSPTAKDLFGHLRKQQEPIAFAFAHVGGRYADIDTHDEEIELAVEIHSAWGTFEWMLSDALDRGYRVGVCANSDGHKCRPGASYPGASTFGSYGGLTCVMAEELTRESIYQALKSRRFYATTGARILIDLEMDAGHEEPLAMGMEAVTRSREVSLRFHIAGSAPIEKVDIFNGNEIIHTAHTYSADNLGSRIKLIWRGAEVRGRDRVVHWDGSLKVKGNRIRGIQPINFWNADQPLQQTDEQNLRWKSATTGGLTGMILDLEKGTSGTLLFHSIQGEAVFELGETGLEPQTVSFGGLQKEVGAYRLPDENKNLEFARSVNISKLQKGTNPIYVRITQEDGHMAWSSPIYLEME